MGLSGRHSIKLFKGLKVNFGKTGASLTIGSGKLRNTIHTSGRNTSTIGIPGTGMSYTHSTNWKKGKKAKPSTSKKAGTAKKTAAQSGSSSSQQTAAQVGYDETNPLQAVEEYNRVVTELKSVHKNCDDVMDWQQIVALAPPFAKDQPGPEEQAAAAKLEQYKPSFFDKLLSKDDDRVEDLEQAVAAARQQDEQTYADWEAMHTIAQRVLDGDKQAYLEVIADLNPLDDLLEYGSGFEFAIERSGILEVEFIVVSDQVLPTEKLGITKTGRLSRRKMPISKYNELFQDYVCSSTIRIARDLMAILPLDYVLVHATDGILNTATGHQEQLTLLSVRFDRRTLSGLNFDLVDPSDAITNFKHQMDFTKTKGFQPVFKIE